MPLIKKENWNFNPLWTTGKAKDGFRDLALWFYPIITFGITHYVFFQVLIPKACPAGDCAPEVHLDLLAKYGALATFITLLVSWFMITVYRSAREYHHVKGPLEQLLNNKKLFSLDSKKPFYRHLIFSWALRVPFYASMAAVVLLFVGDDSPADRDLAFSAAGFSELMKLFAMPMYLLALMGAAGVMVARFHRSKQLAESLIESERKNNFDMRFKHEEEFGKYVEKLPCFEFNILPDQLIRVKLIPGRELYRSVFSENKKTLHSTTCSLIDVGVKLTDAVGKVDDKIAMPGPFIPSQLFNDLFTSFPFSYQLITFDTEGREQEGALGTVTDAQVFEILYGVLGLIGSSTEFLEGDVDNVGEFRSLLGKRVTPKLAKSLTQSNYYQGLNYMGLIAKK